MYMIEIILWNQSKISLLGVIRQIPLHAQFRVTLFDNFNDISTFTTYGKTIDGVTLLFQEFFQIRQT